MSTSPKPARWIQSFAAVALAANLLLTLPGHAFGLRRDRKLDAKRQIELLEQEWRIAQLGGDLPSMDRLLSDDYVGITMTGQVNTKAQLLSRIRNRVFVVSEMDLREMKVKIVGDVAIVTVRARVRGINEGKPVEGNFRYTRIYHRLSTGIWKITNFEATRIPTHHGAIITVSGIGKSG